MDRIWQLVWDRYGPQYSWAMWVVVFVPMLAVFLMLSFIVVALEKSSEYAGAAVVTAVVVIVDTCVVVFPGTGRFRLPQQWAAGGEIDRTEALQDTYTWTRAAGVRALWFFPVSTATLLAAVAAFTEAHGWRLLQYATLGAALGTAMVFIGIHTSLQGAMRPVRVALAGDTGVGDALPRSHPTFAAWLNLSMLGCFFTFAVGGSMLAVALGRAGEFPGLFVVVGCLWTALGLPITAGGIVAPSLRPIRDLDEATKRVAAGDYSRRLPVVQDDDLGALAASFNRMQTGLAERQRLQAAFGAYVDPALAARLLEQRDDVFTGERREVTVMFVDVRDFTPFAEANSAEDTVARLNSLFSIVVPAVVEAGGHVNKFLGDGAMAVFGAPNHLANHADAAVDAAVLIHSRVAERFGGELRIGVGINTGVVIAGTIGGGGHLEFTLIGDTTNVAARVEQLTKITGDAILLTQQTVDALTSRPPGLIDRGSPELKGKTAAVRVFGLDLTVALESDE
jgi:adenylate cyclase